MAAATTTTRSRSRKRRSSSRPTPAARARLLAAAQSPQQFETAAKKFDAAVKRFTERLATLKPPSGAKDEQQKLIADLKHFSGTINEVNDKVQTVNARNVEGLVSLVSQLQVDVANVSKDAQSLEDAVNNS